MPTGKYVRSEEVRAERAELVRQKWARGDYASRKKIPWTDDRKKKMAEQANRNFNGKRDGLLGKPRPEEVKAKISETKIGIALDADGRKKRTLRKVIDYKRENWEKIGLPIQRRYRARHREELSAKVKERYLNDLSFKLKRCLRESVYRALRGRSKSMKTLELLGCEIGELRRYLEKQFHQGMSWENYGFWGWHIDHIRPCASFDLVDELQQKQCFHFTNLQPLWRLDNLRKGSKIGWTP